MIPPLVHVPEGRMVVVDTRFLIPDGRSRVGLRQDCLGSGREDFGHTLWGEPIGERDTTERQSPNRRGQGSPSFPFFCFLVND